MSPKPNERVSTTTARAIVRWRRFRRGVRDKLTWNRLYRTTSYLKSALWTVPIIAIVLELLLTPFLRELDAWLQWRVSGLEVTGAQALYQTVITLTLSFLVFTFGSLLVAIQIAGGQLTPRIIATTLLRDNVVRYSVGLFVFTLVFAVSALNHQEKAVLEIVALLTGVLGVASIADFLFLIDYAARLLRPVSIVARIGDEGVAVIKAVYPAPATVLPKDSPELRPLPPAPTRTVPHEGRSEIVLAVDLPTLVAAARRHDGAIEFLPQVGDFVAADEPLFALYGGAVAIDDSVLRATVAFGPERTLEQDPMFAFRILVDIALKALSPAINDPTTGVLAIDQVHRLLRVLGKRELHGEVIPDAAGNQRVIFRTPNWDDFVHVACTEIRACGANNIQIARRLRAMLDNLRRTLPEHRHDILRRELDVLDRTIRTIYTLPEELALASVPDPQGLGGSSRAPVLGPG
ncbi:MAG TPA: DUF2254 domain-containing protein [Casimicrobiaceae bacterium]|nr:DUF2254 domain-containing protein [Casimicrobiaceae bacterium]